MVMIRADESTASAAAEAEIRAPFVTKGLWRRLRSQHAAMVALAYIVLLIVAAVFANVLSPNFHASSAPVPRAAMSIPSMRMCSTHRSISRVAMPRLW